jgi:hypothetical protein
MILKEIIHLILFIKSIFNNLGTSVLPVAMTAEFIVTADRVKLEYTELLDYFEKNKDSMNT